MTLTLALYNSPLNAVGTGQIQILTMASGRRLEFDLKGHHTLSFSLPGQHFTAGLVRPRITDVMAWWSDSSAPMMRFRVLSTRITSAGGTVQMTVNCVSYRALVDAWIFHDDDQRSWAATPQSQIMWEIFNAGQSKAYGNLGVVRGNIPDPDQVRDRVGVPDPSTGTVPQYYAAGMRRLEALNNLQDVDGGPEWDIVPTSQMALAFHVWNQRGRTDIAQTLELVAGSTVSDWAMDNTSLDYANVIRTLGRTQQVEGSSFSAPAPWSWSPGSKDPLGSGAEGRWEKASTSEGVTQTAVDEDASAQLARANDPDGNYTLTLKDGLWDGPSSLWLGDETKLLIQVPIDSPEEQLFLIDISKIVRVLKLTLSVDEAGGEVVTVSVGKPPEKQSGDLHDLRRRLSSLELW